MRNDDPNEVFVFPLRGLVFFPTTTLPLNIFEPRYIRMVRDAVEQERLIAVSPLDPLDRRAEDHHPSELIVGAGKVQILEERPDGTMLVAIRGSARLGLGELTAREPYIRALSRPAPVDARLSPDASVRLAHVRKRLVAWMEANLANVEWRERFAAGVHDPLTILEHAALYLIEDGEIRQLLQELDDLESRVKLLDARILGTYATGSAEVN